MSDLFAYSTKSLNQLYQQVTQEIDMLFEQVAIDSSSKESLRQRITAAKKILDTSILQEQAPYTGEEKLSTEEIDAAEKEFVRVLRIVKLTAVKLYLPLGLSEDKDIVKPVHQLVTDIFNLFKPGSEEFSRLLNLVMPDALTELAKLEKDIEGIEKQLDMQTQLAKLEESIKEIENQIELSLKPDESDELKKSLSEKKATPEGVTYEKQIDVQTQLASLKKNIASLKKNIANLEKDIKKNKSNELKKSSNEKKAIPEGVTHKKQIDVQTQLASLRKNITNLEEGIEEIENQLKLSLEPNKLDELKKSLSEKKATLEGVAHEYKDIVLGELKKSLSEKRAAIEGVTYEKQLAQLASLEKDIKEIENQLELSLKPDESDELKKSSSEKRAALEGVTHLEKDVEEIENPLELSLKPSELDELKESLNEKKAALEGVTQKYKEIASVVFIPNLIKALKEIQIKQIELIKPEEDDEQKRGRLDEAVKAIERAYRLTQANVINIKEFNDTVNQIRKAIDEEEISEAEDEASETDDEEEVIETKNEDFKTDDEEEVIETKDEASETENERRLNIFKQKLEKRYPDFNSVINEIIGKIKAQGNYDLLDNEVGSISHQDGTATYTGIFSFYEKVKKESASITIPEEKSVPDLNKILLDFFRRILKLYYPNSTFNSMIDEIIREIEAQDNYALLDDEIENMVYKSGSVTCNGIYCLYAKAIIAKINKESLIPFILFTGVSENKIALDTFTQIIQKLKNVLSNKSVEAVVEKAVSLVVDNAMTLDQFNILIDGLSHIAGLSTSENEQETCEALTSYNSLIQQLEVRKKVGEKSILWGQALLTTGISLLLLGVAITASLFIVSIPFAIFTIEFALTFLGTGAITSGVGFDTQRKGFKILDNSEQCSKLAVLMTNFQYESENETQIITVTP